MPERVSFPPPSSRFSVSERRAAIVGRDAELKALEDALALVTKKDQARCVTVLGASGLGKTRLVREFLVKVRAELPESLAPRVFRGYAREHGATYEVFARALRARFGIVEGMDPEAAKAQVRAQLGSVFEDRKVGDVAYFLGQLLDLEFLDSPLIKAVQGDPGQMVAMRRAVIKRFLEADSLKGEGTLVLALDDLQWAHDDSLDNVAYLVENLRAPILVLCLARPELIARREGWTRHGGERHTVVELSPLADADAAEVMRDLLSPCGGATAVEELVDAACTLAGGNPALLEQMIRIFRDKGVLEISDDFGEEGWTIHLDKLAGVRLPLTVEDAVQARIAALAPAERDLLERAATMGGVFWLGGLVAIQRVDAQPPEPWRVGEAPDIDKLRDTLNELVERDYVLRLPDSAFAGDEEYVFKHNLEREALVRMTPPAAARRYHTAVAEWLAFKDNVKTSEEYLTMLARHREKAGRKSQAAGAYLEAGNVARAQYANGKAAELYAKGLAMLREGAEADEALRLGALHHYGDVLQLLGRNDEAQAAFREMLTRAYRLDLRAKGGAAESRIGRLYRETGKLEDAATYLVASLGLFQAAEDQRGIASALDDIGKLHWLRGDYPRALEFTKQALEMRKKIGDLRSIALSFNNLGLVFQDSGQLKLAVEAFESALRVRKDIGDLVGVSVTLNNLGTVAQDLRDDRRALTLFTEALDVAKETGDRNRIALILTNLGETHNRLGDATAAVNLLKEASVLCEELGDKLGLAEAVRGMGKAYVALRDETKAKEALERAALLFEEVERSVELGVALRALGEVVGGGGGGDVRAATEHLKKSIAIFEKMGNDVELARSCRAYADLLRASPDHARNAAIQQESRRMTARAEEILARLKSTGYAVVQ